MLLGISMAISAIPTGMPTFVQSMLAMGAQQLADGEGHRAQPQRRRDPRRDQPDQHRQDRHPHPEPDDRPGACTTRGSWYTVDGEGYSTDRRRSAASPAPRTPTSPRWPTSARWPATPPSADSGEVVGDPTEAAVVVLAEKIGVVRRGDPAGLPAGGDRPVRLGLQVHGHVPPRCPTRASDRLVGLVKGGPDVVLARCTRALRADGSTVPTWPRSGPTSRPPTPDSANAACGCSHWPCGTLPDRPSRRRRWPTRWPPSSDLVFLGLVGIIDPLRPEAIEAVRVAHGAGHRRADDHRRPPGHRRRPSPPSSGLGPGGMSGAEFAAHGDDGARPHGCRSCTCSAGSPRRTSCAWCSSCRHAATSWR